METSRSAAVSSAWCGAITETNQPGAASARSPLAVYVHLPYCAKRCPYCDFNTYVVHRIPEERYAAALEREAAFAAGRPEWQARRIGSVFFGGGTPSLFSPATVGRLLELFGRLWGYEPDAEITLEANPGSLEGGGEEKLRAFRAAGIGRVSFGAQSFNATHLATLGRIHSADETRDAISAARRAGFENVSCDLIYGIPGQTVGEWQDDLAIATALATDHVSAYCLTYETGTPMTGMKNAGLVTPADEETELEMFRLTREILGDAGLAQYEVSNFARPGRESRHNLAYWTWRDYLGLGAGAHGFSSPVAASGDATAITAAGGAPANDAGGDAKPVDVAPGACFGRRYSNHRLPDLYMSAADGAWHAAGEELTRAMAMSEYLLVGLRLARGIDGNIFRQTFGVALEEAAPALDAFVERGLLRRQGATVALTDRGLEIADAVITRLAAG